jgi:hypothetical protein
MVTIVFLTNWSNYRTGARVPMTLATAELLVSKGFARYADKTPTELPTLTAAASDELEAPTEGRRRGRPPRANPPA